MPTDNTIAEPQRVKGVNRVKVTAHFNSGREGAASSEESLTTGIAIVDRRRAHKNNPRVFVTIYLDDATFAETGILEIKGLEPIPSLSHQSFGTVHYFEDKGADESGPHEVRWYPPTHGFGPRLFIHQAPGGRSWRSGTVLEMPKIQYAYVP